jgi:hypothetical protein
MGSGPREGGALRGTRRRELEHLLPAPSAAHLLGVPVPALFPLFGWGLGLVLHAVFGLSSRVGPRRLNRVKRRLQRRHAEEGALHARVAPPSARVRLDTDASAGREQDAGTSEPPKAGPRTAR